MGMLRNLKKYLYLLPALFVSINSERNYNVYTLESDRLCRVGASVGIQLSPSIVEIGRDEHSGAIIEESVYFDSLSGQFPFSCQFKVKAIEPDMGVFAVIQKMRLRKNKTTGECIDYVQFRHTSAYQLGPLNLELKKYETTWGEKHCGHINAKEVDFSAINPTDQSRVLPHAYVDNKGKMDVRIHVANESSQHFRGKDLELRIAFTTYLICDQSTSRTYKKCGADSCIFYKYFNDDILNCPFTTCMDENGCQFFYEANLRPGTGLATKVMVGAVAGVFTMFVVFVVFLWLFRHCSLCWNSSAGSNVPSATQMRPVPTVEDVQPTAPARTPSLEKDLPPSYESLFPQT